MSRYRALLKNLFGFVSFAATCSLPLLAKPVPSRTVGAKVTRLEVMPSNISLNTSSARQHVLITAILANGEREDVTDKALWQFDKPNIVQLAPPNRILPVSDGKAIATVRWGSQQAHFAISVQGVRRPVTYDFVQDVIPTLSRTGCNQGVCHGAAQGKGGFRLSLRGYAPEIDYASITRQLGGRRISREAPERSLFLRKPLLEVAHRGGKVLDKNSDAYRVLLGWIEQGAIGATGKEPTLTKLEVFPNARTMRLKETQRLLVRATLSDGTTHDVTQHALFSSNDIAVAAVTPSGVALQQRAGETAVLAKYRDKIAVARFLMPYPQTIAKASFPKELSPIDGFVNRKLQQLHLSASPTCTDNEYVRRVAIDTIGTLPTAQEVEAFLNDTAPDKRTRLIDTLLARSEFGQVWGLKMGDLFVLRREYMGRKSAMIFQQWLAEQFNANRTWSQVATDILTTKGDLESNRQGFFYVSRAPGKNGSPYWIRGDEATSEIVAQVFLGNRIQCAKCHNHPSEKVTQDDYYHFVALWSQVGGSGENTDGIPEGIATSDQRDIQHPRTGQKMEPRPFDRSSLTFAKDEDRRVKAAEWLIQQDDFARNIVNRVWARCFGQGIVEPVDDIRSTNPAKNEPLMRWLCDDMRRHNFDVKYLMKAIMLSQTYQRSALPNPTNRIDTRLFAYYPARRLPAEELADAVAQVTGVMDRFGGMPAGVRAIELPDTEIPSIMLDTFGRPPRVQPSDTERTCNPAMSQALALLNGSEVQSKINSGSCVLTTLLKSGKPDTEILDALFLSAIARRPNSSEAKALLELLKSAPKIELGWQDILWALVNSKEFMFQH